MAMLNVATYQGRVGKIEKKDSSKGGIVVMRLAHTENKRDPHTPGAWIEDTDWQEVVYFGYVRDGKDSADSFIQKVEVGDLITVVGKLKATKWSNSEGKEQEKKQIIINQESWDVKKKTQRSASYQPPAKKQDAFGDINSNDEWG